MDLVAPPLDEQAAPPPHLEMRQKVDLHALIRRVIDEHPGASPDRIARETARQGHQVSGIWVARLMQSSVE